VSLGGDKAGRGMIMGDRAHTSIEHVGQIFAEALGLTLGPDAHRVIGGPFTEEG
jgi:hypothetical protein